MQLLTKLRWYANRLAAMSAPEIAFRLREACKRRIDRVSTSSHVPEPVDMGTLPQLPGLKETLQRWKLPEALLLEWQDHLRQAVSGKFFLLNQYWPDCPRERRWHLDPVSSTYWPEDRFCFAIDYRHAGEKGDVKYAWELGRLQHLQPIAALACLQGNSEIANFALSELESWIDRNPPHCGIHWASGIELAMRIVSILMVTTLIGEHATAAQRAKIWGTLQAHALWLERYPSRFSSANNHMAAEGLGLFAVGALCSQLPRATHWRAQGWAILVQAARAQILADGAGAEQAVSYGAFLCEMLLLGRHIALATGFEMSEDYLPRIAREGEYLRWLTDSAGNHPHIGDDDNARVIGAWRREEPYTRSVLSCIAAAANRPDLSPPGTEPGLRHALFGLPFPSDTAPSGMRTFHAGGYTIGRHTALGSDILLAMDHGPLGYLAIAAHGHADTLAIWLHIDGQPVLVDAGTYLYHSGGDWRNYFRGTRAHNTLCLEQADSSMISGPFNWSQKARTTLHASVSDAAGWHVDAEHDGYHKRFGVCCRRLLEVTPESGFTVTDRITGKVGRKVEIGFLLHPALRAVRTGDAIHVLKAGRTLLRIRHESQLAAIIGDAGSGAGGWYSPSFGEKHPTTRIVFSGTLAPDQPAVTRFAYA